MLKVKCKEINGKKVFIRPDTPDAEVAESCFSGEFDIVIQLLSLAKAPFSILDIGGYIGTAAISFTELDQAHVISLEPSPLNYPILCLNTLSSPRITPVNAAVGPSQGSAPIFARDTGEWGHTLVSSPKDCPTPSTIGTTKVETIESVISQYCHEKKPVAAIKIDIEGGEKDLLQEADSWFASTPIVLIELHDRIQDGCSESWTNLLKRHPSRISIMSGGEKFISVDPYLLKSIINVT